MEFNANSFTLFDKKWALLTAGEIMHFNAMTISWGGLGTLWSRPVATVYVKPIRYTHELMEQNELFTVSFYSENYRKALGIFGTLSGRDHDKVALSGLTPIELKKAVTFNEAEVTLLCRKLYRQDLDTSNMPQDVIKDYYINEAAHTMYIGEVIDILHRSL